MNGQRHDMWWMRTVSPPAVIVTVSNARDEDERPIQIGLTRVKHVGRVLEHSELLCCFPVLSLCVLQSHWEKRLLCTPQCLPHVTWNRNMCNLARTIFCRTSLNGPFIELSTIFLCPSENFESDQWLFLLKKYKRRQCPMTHVSGSGSHSGRYRTEYRRSERC